MNIAVIQLCKSGKLGGRKIIVLNTVLQAFVSFLLKYLNDVNYFILIVIQY
jgi:hypothetical protein